MSNDICIPHTKGSTFKKEVMVDGKPAIREFVELAGRTFAIDRGLINKIYLEDEWYEDVEDPYAVIDALSAAPQISADLFSFWQRVPDTDPRYAFHRETEELAVLPIKSYDDWWNNQLKSRTRNLIRKSEKKGLVIEKATYNDAFIHGMTAIFNETPNRQGKRFWHYGKDFETVKEQFSRNLYREDLIGAYYEGELIGFIMLGDAGRYGLPGQILSSIQHRDKATNNALIAAAVKACAERGLEYLVYFYWSGDSLAEFKRRCGFKKVEVPRYYIPLTRKGKFVLERGLHRGLRAKMPEGLKSTLKKARSRWYG